MLRQRFASVSAGIGALASALACGSEEGAEQQFAVTQRPFSNQYGGVYVGSDDHCVKPLGADCLPTHELITLDGLGFLKSGVKNYLAFANARFDAQSFLVGAAHFDNCLFRQSSELARQHMDDAVARIFSFPDYDTLPTEPGSYIVPGGSISDRQDDRAALDAFAAVLHTMQDFYAHTNWIEQGKLALFNSDLGRLPVFEPYGTFAGLVVVNGELPPGGWSIVPPARSATYPDNVKVSVRYRRDVFPALISGETEGTERSRPSNCPKPPGVPPVTHDVLAKDPQFAHSLEHSIAKTLATRQTAHEWCRLVSLTFIAHPEDGVDFLCENWVEDAVAANEACPSLPQEARCPETTVLRFEEGAPGVDGTIYGTSDTLPVPRAGERLVRSGYAFDVEPNSTSATTGLHFHEVNSADAWWLPTQTGSGPGVLARDGESGVDPVVLTREVAGSTFKLRSLVVGFSSVQGLSATNLVVMSGYLGGSLVGSKNITMPLDTYTPYDKDQLGALGEQVLDRLDFVGFSSGGGTYFMLDDVRLTAVSP